MRLDLELAGGLVSFSEPSNVAAAYRWLEEVGALGLAAVAGAPSGSGAGESPSLEVTLRNDRNRAADIIGSPLRAPATVYDDDGSTFFAGTVAAMKLGRTIVLTLEA